MTEPTSTSVNGQLSTNLGHASVVYHTELSKRKLSMDEAAAQGIYYLDANACRELVGGRKQEAVAIPYHDLQGNPIPGFVRVRYLGHIPEQYNKYGQRKGSGTHYYFPRGFDWQMVASNPSVKLIITEGEFKALAIAQALAHEKLIGQFAVCAVAGVSCALAKGQAKLHADLQEFKWEAHSHSVRVEREVYVCYDYDGQNKGNAPGEPRAEVAQAEAQLVVLLKGAGATVKLCRVGSFTTSPNEKYAVDDFLHSGRNLLELLMRSEEPAHNTIPGNKNRLYEFAAKYVICGKHYLELTTGAMYSENDMRVVTGDMSYIDAGPRGGQAIKYIYQDYARWNKRVVLKGRTMDPRYMGRKITPDNYYNSCPDFPYRPVEGPVDPWLRFTRYFFADMPELEGLWHQWVGHAVQLPWIKQHTCWQFLSSETGKGKSFIAEWCGKMFGVLHRVMGPGDAFERHNALLEGIVWLVVNEPSTDFESHANQIKHLVTSPEIVINPKGIGQYTIPNYINCIFTSNRPYVSVMEKDSRREIVYSPKSADKQVVKDLVQAVVDWCATEHGLEKMLYYYGTVDLTGYDPKAPAVMTSDKQQAQSLAQNSYTSFATQILDMVYARLKDREMAIILPVRAVRGWYGFVEGGFKSVTSNQLKRGFHQYNGLVEFYNDDKGEPYIFIGTNKYPSLLKCDPKSVELIQEASKKVADSLSKEFYDGLLNATGAASFKQLLNQAGGGGLLSGASF